MSCVTSVMLTGPFRDVALLVEDLNAYLVDHNHGCFRQVDAYAGGTKGFESALYIGGFNYLDENKFMECYLQALNDRRIEDPFSIQLFFKGNSLDAVFEEQEWWGIKTRMSGRVRGAATQWAS